MADTTEKIIIRETVDVNDPEYFCNKSWTLSFNMNTKSWISFHSYIPNWYIAENNFFYSGLNTGCDLEAIAVEEVPYVPPTTTSTTTCKQCKPAPTTTTTTTQGLDCTIDGFVSVLDCAIDGIAYDITPSTTTTTTSSTTTFNCTTSTTTTACPSCSTYIITNSEAGTFKSASYTDCNSGAQIDIVVNSLIPYQVCSCSEPILSEGLSSTLYSSMGCYSCFCYELTNTSLCDAKVFYTNCADEAIELLLAPLETVNICVKDRDLGVADVVAFSGGLDACSSNEDCSA